MSSWQVKNQVTTFFSVAEIPFNLEPPPPLHPPPAPPGLESFSSQPALQASLEEVAAGKILLMEVLEVLQFQGPPEVVLYDTSQEEDVNINAVCLGALQDQTMKNLLSVRPLSFSDQETEGWSHPA